jgi:hypothetical protein
VREGDRHGIDIDRCTAIGTNTCGDMGAESGGACMCAHKEEADSNFSLLFNLDSRPNQSCCTSTTLVALQENLHVRIIFQKNT